MRKVKVEMVSYDEIPDENIFVKAAADLVGPYSEAELHAFAACLCGLGGLTAEEIMQKLKGLQVPKDFIHIKINSLERGEWVYQAISTVLQPTSLHRIIIILLHAQRHERTHYEDERVLSEVVAMPIVNPGMLELGIRLRPRLPSDSQEDVCFSKERFDAVVYSDVEADEARTC
jgi:hypothetical protein